jgi:shikimate dehydrogenase
MSRCFVIGSPIAHSRSPLIHRLFAEQHNMSLCYEKREVAANGVAQALAEFRAAGVRGVNVTLPLKEEACQLADILYPRAASAEAANTLWFDDAGRIHADNTDGYGLMADLERLGITLQGASVLLLGAGGASRGVLGELVAAQPARLVLMNRTLARAEQLAARYELECLTPDVHLPQAFDLVINATSIGLGANREISLHPSAVAPRTACYDMVYGRGETAFLQWAAARGANQRHDGLGMLVAQAAEAFRLWHGLSVATPPVIDFVRKRLLG